MKQIIIVIDMQNGFTNSKNTKKLSDGISNLLQRNLFDVVIATRFHNYKNSMYEKCLFWDKLQNEEEIRITEQLEKYIDLIVDKRTYNCVNQEFIKKLCQLNEGEKPEKVFVVGVDTDCCVLTIATSLFENGIRPVVLTQYVASNGGDDSHRAGLTVLKRLIGEKQLCNKDPMDLMELNKI